MDKKTLEKAIKTASKKISLQSVKQRNANLEYAADCKAEAYEIGVEETQREIIARLQALLKEC